jgi:TonB family protein
MERSRRFKLLLFVLSAAAAPALRADATIRYQSETKHAAGLPAIFENSLTASGRFLPLPNNVFRFKGHQIVGGSSGHPFIIDFEKHEVTIVDSVRKTVATLPLADFTAIIKAVASATPPLPKVTGKPKVESRMTGRADVIQGVQVEERDVTLVWELATAVPIPEDARLITVHSQIWSATAAESSRVPAIREISKVWAGKADQNVIFSAFLPLMPGLGPEDIQAFDQPPVILRVHIEFFAPLVALAARKIAERDHQEIPDINPKGAVMTMDQVVTELSDAPVDPSLFDTPKDYKVLSPDDVRQAMQAPVSKLPMSPRIVSPPSGVAGGVIGGIAGSAQTTAPLPPPPPVSNENSPTPRRLPVGANVQQAKLIRQPKPVYPPLARQARVEGTVKLDAIIAKDGTVQDLKVVSGDPLLAPAALEAVKQWVYSPTKVNGEFVEVATQIDVNFSLSNPSWVTIVNQSGGRCLDVSTTGGPFVQGCHDGPSQQWEVRDNGQIVSKESSKCLDVPDSNATGYDTIKLATCNLTFSTQGWETGPNGELLHQSSGKCLDVQVSSTGNTEVALSTCNGSVSQKWTLSRNSSEGIARVGQGVSPPVPIQRPGPHYPKKARAAKVQGTVVVYIEVDTNGKPRNVRVVRGLGFGLDEEAIKTVEQWRFRPGYKDGRPVIVAATVEVNFRLR